MTDSEGEQVVTGQVTGMDETEAGIPLTMKWYIYWVVCGFMDAQNVWIRRS